LFAGKLFDRLTAGQAVVKNSVCRRGEVLSILPKTKPSAEVVERRRNEVPCLYYLAIFNPSWRQLQPADQN